MYIFGQNKDSMEISFPLKNYDEIFNKGFLDKGWELLQQEQDILEERIQKVFQKYIAFDSPIDGIKLFLRDFSVDSTSTNDDWNFQDFSFEEVNYEHLKIYQLAIQQLEEVCIGTITNKKTNEKVTFTKLFRESLKEKNKKFYLTPRLLQMIAKNNSISLDKDFEDDNLLEDLVNGLSFPEDSKEGFFDKRNPNQVLIYLLSYINGISKEEKRAVLENLKEALKTLKVIYDRFFWKKVQIILLVVFAFALVIISFLLIRAFFGRNRIH